MDFADERDAGKVVLLYTQRSPTWRRWPWQARLLFPQLLVMAHPAGLIDLAEQSAEEVIAEETGMPLEHVEVALVALFGSRSIVRVERGLLVTRWADAQPEGGVDNRERIREQTRLRNRRYRAKKREERSNPQLILIPPVTPSRATADGASSAQSSVARRDSVTLRHGDAAVGGVDRIDLCSPITEGGASSPVVAGLTLSSLPAITQLGSGDAGARENGYHATLRTSPVAASGDRAPAVTPTRSGRVYVGRLASSGELAEVAWWRGEALALVEVRHRARVPPLTADVAELAPGVARAIDEYGAATVRDVVRWAVLETGAGRMSPRHFRALFNGDSFPLRVHEMHAHVEGEAADQHTVSPELAEAIAKARRAVELGRETLAIDPNDERAPPPDIRPSVEADLARAEARLAELLAQSRKPNGAPSHAR